MLSRDNLVVFRGEFIEVCSIPGEGLVGLGSYAIARTPFMTEIDKPRVKEL